MAEPNVSAAERAHTSGHSHVTRYFIVWGALLVFTIATWAISRLHLAGGWGVAVALAIAVTKGTLVALFFMHLWDQQGANRLVFITSLVFVSLLVGITMLDNATRFPLANPPGSAGALPAAPTDYGPQPPAPPQSPPVRTR